MPLTWYGPDGKPADEINRQLRAQAAEHGVFDASEVEQWYEDVDAPLDALPEPLKRYSNEVCRAYSVSEDMVLAFMLSVAAGAIGASADVLVHRKWREISSLWFGVVAPPGGIKSPVLAEICGALLARDSELAQAHTRSIAQWKDEPSKERGPRPIRRQLVVRDATMESLALVLERSPHGVLIINDELASLFNRLGAYKAGRGDDRQNLLSLHNGASLLVNRKGQREGDPIAIERPRVSVVGCCTPTALRDIRDAFARNGSDGLLDRFCWVNAPRIELKIRNVEVHDANWNDTIWRLSGATDGTEPRVLEFEQAAYDRFKEHVTPLSNEMLPPELECLAGSLDKRRGLIARLSLVLALLHDPAARTVDIEILEKAISVENWIWAHQVRTWTNTSDYVDRLPLSRRARRLYKRLRRCETEGRPLARRDLQRSLRLNAATLEVAIGELLGWKDLEGKPLIGFLTHDGKEYVLRHKIVVQCERPDEGASDTPPDDDVDELPELDDGDEL